MPTGAPDRKGKPLKVVDIPKLVGVGYFNSTASGIQEAAKELGSMTVTTDGPTKANIDEQITFIDKHHVGVVDGILFAANDPVAIAPVLKRALEAGINVVGYDADAEADARQWFVNQAEPNGVAKSMIDQLASEIGEEGSFAIVTSTFTTPNQARWISEMGAYAEKCHPRSSSSETVEAQEDNILSFNQADADQQVRRRAEGHPRHDVGRDPGRLGGRAAEEAVRQGLGGRPCAAERDEALHQQRLHQVDHPLVDGRSWLSRGMAMRAVPTAR